MSDLTTVDEAKHVHDAAEKTITALREETDVFEAEITRFRDNSARAETESRIFKQLKKEMMSLNDEEEDVARDKEKIRQKYSLKPKAVKPKVVKPMMMFRSRSGCIRNR